MKTALDFLRADPWLALYGLFMAFGSSFGQTFFIAQFGGEIRADFGLSDAQFGTVYGLATLLSAAVIVYTGGVIDRVDLRRWTLCLLPTCALACALMGLAEGVAALFAAIFLLRQTGQGLMSHTMGHSLGRYSRVGRGKAVAFGSYGFPIGEALFPLLGVGLIAWIGWRETWFGLSAAYLLISLPVALMLLRGHDQRYADYRIGQDADDAAALLPENPGAAPRPVRSWRRREVLRDLRFYLVVPGMITPSFLITGLFLHGVRISELKGWSPELWAGSIIFYAVGGIPTSLIFGAYIDRVGTAKGLPFFLPTLILACLVLGWGEGVWTAPAFMLISGLGSGILAVLAVALWAEHYGTRYLGEIKAMMTALSIFASAAGPPVLGFMLDWNWSIAEICIASALFTTGAWGLSLIAARRYAAR